MNFVTFEIDRNNSNEVSHFMVTILFSIYRVNIKIYACQTLTENKKESQGQSP